MEFEDPEEEEDAIPITSYDPVVVPQYSSAPRPLKMSTTHTHTHTHLPDHVPNETRSSSSSSPPPSPLSLSIPPMIKKPTAASSRYRECLKNHAVGIGGHAVDGCGEFMPSGEEGTIDALSCAACTCHRNFHRKEVGPTAPHHQHHSIAAYYPHHQQPAPIFQFQSYGRTSPVQQQQQQQQRPLALPSADQEPEREMMMISSPMAAMGLGSSGKKRFRTKFTPDHKEKMLELAEKIGWRLQKQDEEVIQHFCHETGLKRKVLKVWMHNNKQTYLRNKP